MPIHLPKLITSTQGLGLNTTMKMKYITDNLAIGVELWGEPEKPWAEGETIIALEDYKWVSRWEVGLPYVITKFYDDKGILAGIYCDIARPVRRIKDGFEFDDMYLDVWQVPGREPVILDEDELEEACTAGYVTQKDADNAGLAAQEVLRLFAEKSALLDFDLQDNLTGNTV